MLKFAERKVFVSFLMIFSDNTKFGFIKRCSYKAIGNEWVVVKEYFRRGQFSIKAIRRHKTAVME